MTPAARMAELEDRLVVAKIIARRLWAALKARPGREIVELMAEDVFTADVAAMVDPTFDAAQIVWEKHRVVIEPCRRVMDHVGYVPCGFGAHPSQPEMYIGRFPDGSVRNLTRAQLLMMGGMDPDEGDRP